METEIKIVVVDISRRGMRSWSYIWIDKVNSSDSTCLGSVRWHSSDPAVEDNRNLRVYRDRRELDKGGFEREVHLLTGRYRRQKGCYRSRRREGSMELPLRCGVGIGPLGY